MEERARPTAPAQPIGGARIGQRQLGPVARSTTAAMVAVSSSAPVVRVGQLQLGLVEHARSLAVRKPGKRARQGARRLPLPAL